jgi:tetratricopeptide (TPR) repeat protein
MPSRRTAAFEYNMQGKPDEAWRYLEQALAIWPDIFRRLDTFYEMACGNQPRGQRGKADLLDIDSNGATLIERLDLLFAQAQLKSMSLKSVAYGNSYLALAMLSDQAGRWGSGRQYLRQAVKANPRLAGSLCSAPLCHCRCRPHRQTRPLSDAGAGTSDR